MMRCLIGYHYHGCKHSDNASHPVGPFARFIKRNVFDTWELPKGRALKFGPVRLAQFAWAYDQERWVRVVFGVSL